MLTLIPATLVLSECCLGRACNIYGLHRGPLDCLAEDLFCPSGLDRMGAWWKESAVFWLSDCWHIHIASPLPLPSSPDLLSLLIPLIFSPLPSRCTWLMLPDPLHSPGSCRPSLCLNAGVNHRNYHSALHLFSPLLSRLCSVFSSVGLPQCC